MKGVVQNDIIPKNKYKLFVVGFAPITAIEVSGIEDEVQTSELPDGTIATGGRKPPIEFTFSTPFHHTIEQKALEGWYQEGQDPVSPGYKKEMTLTFLSNSGLVLRSYSISGAFLSKRALPAGEVASEGEMTMVTWTCKADDINPLS